MWDTAVYFGNLSQSLHLCSTCVGGLWCAKRVVLWDLIAVNGIMGKLPSSLLCILLLHMCACWFGIIANMLMHCTTSVHTIYFEKQKINLPTAHWLVPVLYTSAHLYFIFFIQKQKLNEKKKSFSPVILYPILLFQSKTEQNRTAPHTEYNFTCAHTRNGAISGYPYIPTYGWNQKIFNIYEYILYICT